MIMYDFLNSFLWHAMDECKDVGKLDIMFEFLFVSERMKDSISNGWTWRDYALDLTSYHTYEVVNIK